MSFLELVQEASERLDTSEPAQIAQEIYDDVDEDTWLQLLKNAVISAQSQIRSSSFNYVEPEAKDVNVKATTNSRAARIRLAWPETTIAVGGTYKKVKDLTVEDLKFKIEEATQRIAGINKTVSQYNKLITAIEKAKVTKVGELSKDILEDDKYLA